MGSDAAAAKDAPLEGRGSGGISTTTDSRRGSNIHHGMGCFRGVHYSAGQ